MTTDEFTSRYPQFPHRTMVRKIYDFSHTQSHLTVIYLFLEDWIGEEGEQFKRQPNADGEYHIFWFKNSKHATIFSLKWA